MGTGGLECWTCVYLGYSGVGRELVEDLGQCLKGGVVLCICEL